MALATAIGLGMIAAVGFPFIAERAGVDFDGLLTGELVRIPIGGIELHWSWLIFCVVTLVAWGSLKAAESK
ncbi:hypothetical protein [Sphingomonas abietis]|uniref:Uncharacterized protein n=1 Tax=Sphingomonas abietis TaxID=3012344 RepID=A0ABY7NTQ8_9SPHN|nr:hypothetical protein [Sphingomonas abietis]WBO23324.1 hypothetical protein PBT88_04085 [Sphingomonas abietis]